MGPLLLLIFSQQNILLHQDISLEHNIKGDVIRRTVSSFYSYSSPQGIETRDEEFNFILGEPLIWLITQRHNVQ
jgi:hypothetical protein